MNNQNIKNWQKLTRWSGKICLIVFIVTSLASCKTELYSGIDEIQANEMTSILAQNGIKAQKIKNTKSDDYRIELDSSYFSQAVEILRSKGYPKEQFLNVEDIFRKDGLISSPLEERARYIYAISQDVQETLARIDGVVTARVHVVMPENDPFAEKVKPSSASVFIRYLPEYQLEDIKAEIKLIVQKSIEGLTYDKVSIIMLPASSDLENTTDQNWVSLWGVRLPESSSTRFRLIVWGLVGSNVVLLLIIFMITYLTKYEKREDNLSDENRNLFNSFFSRIISSTNAIFKANR